MSLFAPRPIGMEERASVVLPTVTCSSCAAPIPLSSLGEHICRPPPSRANTGPTPSRFNPSSQQHQQNHYQQPQAGPSNPSRNRQQAPRIDIPSNPHSHAGPSTRGPVSAPADPSPPFIRPYATSSNSSSKGSPASLSIPLHNPSPASLSPHAAAPSPAFGGPSPRTPSPTNPFFPHQNPSPGGTIVHGLGLGVGAAPPPQGPYPTDAPLPAGIQDPMTAVPNTMSGGNAGMAGVGRRAFAAAAWGVRAGVALASSAAATRATNDNASPTSIRPQEGSRPFSPPLSHGGQNAFPQAHPSQHPQPPNRRPSPPAHSHSAPTQTFTRDPQLLPKVSLSDRPRAPFVQAPPSSGSGVSRDPSPTKPIPSRQGSGDSNRSDRQAELRNQAQLERQASQNSTKPFFDRYKQRMQASSSGSNTPEGNSPMLGFGIGGSRSNSNDDHDHDHDHDDQGREHHNATTSALLRAVQDVNDDDDDDDEEGDLNSHLPWATPHLQESPEINQSSTIPNHHPSNNPYSKKGNSSSSHHHHQRQNTAGSDSSTRSSGSSRSGRGGNGSGSGENEEVVTPSQSWDGLSEREPNIIRRGAERDDYGGGVGKRTMDRRDFLEQIREDDDHHHSHHHGEDDDDEGERVVFGVISPKRSDNKSRSRDRQDPPRSRTAQSNHLPNSSSENSLSSRSGDSHDTHSRDRNGTGGYRPPSSTASHETSNTTGTTTRRIKQCVKCQQIVGGSKRFVERDGIILCEKDWKKLYLPSCRRCRLPIEKSAVSSSDGQLKGKWHRSCFTCTTCDTPFKGDMFYVFEGKPWCQFHYAEETNTLCASKSCKQPIEGSCLLTAGPNPQRFHPGHLRCDYKSVTGTGCADKMDEYYEVEDGGKYCERHVNEAMRKKGGGLGDRARLEKRRTRMVDLPRGGLGF